MTDTPLILGFDTSGPYCSAALLKGGDCIAARHDEMARGQAEYLMGLLEEVLDEGRATWQDLTAIGVGTGPGNFTGIRISVAAARGLALSLNIPAVGVSLLDAAAFGTDGPVLTCLQAPRDKAYLASHGMAQVVDPQLTSLDDLDTSLAEPGLTCIGSAAPAVSEVLRAQTAPAMYAPGSAIARLAMLRYKTTTSAPAPLYIRPADAAPSKDQAPTILSDRS